MKTKLGFAVISTAIAIGIPLLVSEAADATAQRIPGVGLVTINCYNDGGVSVAPWSISSPPAPISRIDLAVRFSPSGTTATYARSFNPAVSGVYDQAVSSIGRESSARITGTVRFSNGSSGSLGSGVTAICTYQTR